MSKEPAVIIVVFDGLRPDMITNDLMPNLTAFAKSGIWFREARSVFPSMTRVATTSMATGCLPARHGVTGNTMYFPDVNASRMIDLGSLQEIQSVEQGIVGDFVEMPTFGDALAKAGKQLSVVHTGSAGAAYCINPRALKNHQWTFSIHGRDATQTPQAVAEVVDRFGPLPEKQIPDMPRMEYANKVFIEYVLDKQEPDAALIWFNEPDTTYHYRSIGSIEADGVVRALDVEVGKIIDYVNSRPDSERYTIIVASDHGQVSISREINLFGDLSLAGHAASSHEIDKAVAAMAAWNMGEIKVLDGGEKRTIAIAEWLQEQDYVGNIFSPDTGDGLGAISGTFGYSAAGIGHRRQGDLVFTLRDEPGPPDSKYPGFTPLAAVERGLLSMHGGLSPIEMNSTLMLGGSSIPATGQTSVIAGVIDIAPTICKALNVPIPTEMQGVSLLEAEDFEPAIEHILETGVGSYRQNLKSAVRGSAIYIHSGGRV